MGGGTSAALYIHWPFCKKKCPYCDFNSHVREAVDHAAWQAALIAELHYWRQASACRQITSIFFGGGTPSLMPVATVEALLREVHDLWEVVPDCEITLEANPTSVEAQKFADLRVAGVNRVSLGVQSFDDAALKFLGREHSAREALQAIELAAKTFPRYSFDLIYALPNQTPDVWVQQLRAALPLARGHLSLYQLTIEQNTAFHHAYHVDHAFALPEENHAVELYQVTGEMMAAAGLPRYEISNYAAAGQESRHNLAYWRGDPYFGIGPGAHGRVAVDARSITSPPIGGRPGGGLIQSETSPCGSPHPNPPPMGEGIQCLATTNLKSPERWLQAALPPSIPPMHGGDVRGGIEESTLLTDTERMEEKILMGLRLTQEGFPLARLSPKERATFDARVADGRLDTLIAQGLLLRDGDTLCATPHGQLVLNALIAAVLY